MINREKENLSQWVSSTIARKQAENAERFQQQEAAIRQMQEWKRLQREEVDYFKQSGALEVFKDAAAILRRHWDDTRLKVYTPEIQNSWSYFSLNPSIDLQWDSRPEQVLDRTIHRSKRVFARVVREEVTGKIQGLQLNHEGEIISADPEQISMRLVEAIQKPGEGRMEPPSPVGRLVRVITERFAA